jgi:AmmeMemoRadiSam system protein B
MQDQKNIPSGYIRLPGVAGQFYPDWPEDLRETVEDLLAKASPVPGPCPKAIIAPHAAYSYSGPVAASAYAQFDLEAELIKRVVVVGPCHYLPFRGVALSSAEGFATPLGIVPVDTEAVRNLAGLPHVSVMDGAHADEHSIEVQLPFLQVLLKDFKLVPLLAGDAKDAEICAVIEELWGGPETRFVISSDLSHDRDYASAQRLDSATARCIEKQRADKIGPTQACGSVAVRGMLVAAGRHQLYSRAVDVRNSGDTAGPRDQVVGYGVFTFCCN